jgi:hypothetical protein
MTVKSSLIMKHLHKIGFLLLFLFASRTVLSQSVEAIKQDRNYIWGEGSGATLKAADSQALAMIADQISTTVESKFEHLIDESGKGNSSELHEKSRSVIKTYSSATLNNTERLVISNEPDAKVFRYIKRTEIDKVFRQRKEKIINFVASALTAESETRIGDALRYSYWALLLLKSHPDWNDISFTPNGGTPQKLIAWLPAKIEELFSHLRFETVKNENKETGKTVLLRLLYKNQPVSNLDYCYWDGRDWTNLISAKDGEGFLEYLGATSASQENGRIKAEYMYENQAKIDDELQMVMEKIEPVPFRKSYYDISFTKTASQKKEYTSPVATDVDVVQNPHDYKEIVAKVVSAINQKKYDSVKGLFTDEGYGIFEKLVRYGNAQVLNTPEPQIFTYRNEVMYRAVKMSFAFQNNFRKFVEDVVFHFDGQKKIESLTFGLSEKALGSVLDKNVWKKSDRFVLINFLENYQTAYALKRLDYIESIFADNALIITGSFVKAVNIENRFLNNKILKFNRQTKAEYIKNLKDSFDSKEFINIRFEESDVRKGGAGDNVYGVQIKQNYFSSNYGDTGYLFLMVDLNNPNEPIIHVRTWQPNESDIHAIYGLKDF